MGYGSYSAGDWAKLKTSRQISSTKQVEEVFERRECDPKFNPRFIGTRECFDSDDHPHSTPIVVGLDVTASMGYLAVKVASEALNDLIMKLYSTNAVEDPALMCAAYGDYRDGAPLQVTQFESDIRIAEQLLDLYFEDGGNCQVVIPCLWEFLARHTNIDAINKRGEKGFIFTIGDEAEIRQDSVPETVRRVIGDDVRNATAHSLLAEAEKKFHIFHIMIGNDGNKDFLPGHKIVINKDSVDLIPEIILGTIQLQKGMPFDQVVSQWDSINGTILSNALGQLQITGDGQAVTL